MRARGRLAEPKSSITAREQMAREGSPVLAFIHERCILDITASVEKGALHTAFNSWAAKAGMYPMSDVHFFRDLYTAGAGKVRDGKVDVKGTTTRVIKGVRLALPGEAQKGGSDSEFPF